MSPVLAGRLDVAFPVCLCACVPVCLCLKDTSTATPKEKRRKEKGQGEGKRIIPCLAPVFLSKPGISHLSSCSPSVPSNSDCRHSRLFSFFGCWYFSLLPACVSASVPSIFHREFRRVLESQLPGLRSSDLTPDQSALTFFCCATSIKASPTCHSLPCEASATFSHTTATVVNDAASREKSIEAA
jgi:hypothetical protein